MNYLNIHTDFLRSEDYLGAEPIERATWLNLLAWCASQENGGVIENAASWTDRKWQQLCGVTKEEATLVSDLYQLDEGGNLVVNHYPKDKEEEVKTKRETARVNGRKGGRPKLETKEKPTLVNSAKAEREREGKEKGKEKDKESTPLPPQRGEWDDIFPKGSLNRPKAEQKKIRVLRSNSKMEFVGKWFGRKPETLWTIAEAKALRDLNPSKDEVLEMDRYRNTPNEYHRRDLITLLNNWSGELDRARSAPAKQKSKPDPTCGITAL